MMRSRDASQTICVVCKPVIRKIEIKTDPSAISSESSCTENGNNSNESEALHKISNNILMTLSGALSCTDEIDEICGLIESASKSLKVIKGSSMKLSSNDVYYLNIHQKVFNHLQGPCKSSVTCDIIKYFTDIERLYTLYQEFNSVF